MSSLIPTRGIVAAEARRLGVDLTAVTGTGVGGRIRLSDVRAVAAARPGAGQAAPRAAAPPVLRSLAAGGGFAVDVALSRENAESDAPRVVRQAADEAGVSLRHLTGTGPAGAVTLADVGAAARRQEAQRQREYAAETPPPAETPRVTFTASGLPPAVLEQVPPAVRPAVAAASTAAEAYRLVSVYGAGLSDDEAAERLRSDRSVSVDQGGSGPSNRYSWPH
jgi:pyruvate/2-oxoglutarate dehydrogenase complex dihydrolipoamide acyltransferase (E2) component